ncbi:hypothetical protein LCGC14_3033630, partial [marine sediment metagenome]
MQNLPNQKFIGSIEDYTLVHYECSTKHEGTRGLLFATDLGLIYDPPDNEPAYMLYNDILNFKKIERGDKIYHRLMFHLYPILLIIAFILWMDDINATLQNLLMFSLLPLIVLGRYFIRYLNYLEFDYFIDHRHIAKVRFKLRFVDMIFMY